MGTEEQLEEGVGSEPVGGVLPSQPAQSKARRGENSMQSKCWGRCRRQHGVQQPLLRYVIEPGSVQGHCAMGRAAKGTAAGAVGAWPASSASAAASQVKLVGEHQLSLHALDAALASLPAHHNLRQARHKRSGAVGAGADHQQGTCTPGAHVLSCACPRVRRTLQGLWVQVKVVASSLGP